MVFYELCQISLGNETKCEHVKYCYVNVQQLKKKHFTKQAAPLCELIKQKIINITVIRVSVQ